MKKARLTEEQIIGILQVEEDQKMVWETIFPTKVRQARSARSLPQARDVGGHVLCRRG